MEIAGKANEYTGFEDPGHLDTLAVAYAEMGRFDEAFSTSEKAIDLAQKNGPAELLEILEKNRTSFMAGKPVREE